MPKGKDLLAGRGTRGQNAIGTITPFAERQEDGTWKQVADRRALFPPEGAVELQGVLASQMKDGDWFVFSAGTNNRHRAPTKMKALAARRVSRFLGLPDGETPESRRRALVEIGLEGASAGDWAVKISATEVVRVALNQQADGRWRAEGKDLARLPVRAFNAEAVLPLDVDGEQLTLYDIESSGQTGRSLNWLSDADYLRAVSGALAAGARQEAAAALEALATRADETGELSAAGCVDVLVLEEVVRSGAIAQRLKSDTAAMGGFLTALTSQPETKEALRRLADEKALAEIPRLEAEALSKVKAGWDAETASRLDQVRAAVAELEASELADLSRKRNEALSEIEASTEAAKAEALRTAEEAAEAAKARLQVEVAEYHGRVDAAAAELAGLEVRQSGLSKAVEDLGAAENALAGRIEDLTTEERRLIRRTRWAVGHPVFEVHENVDRLQLKDIEQAARDAGVFSDRGIEVMVEVAVLAAAREVPIVTGPAADVADMAAMLLAGGRVVSLYADPTLVTFDDLWSRPSGAGLTAFGAAAAWVADTGLPLVAHVSGADRSAARFWFPALAEAKRRGLVPGELMILVSLDDGKSEEAKAMPKDRASIDADGLLNREAVPFLPSLTSSMTSKPRELDLRPLAEDHAAAALLLSKHGAPSVTAALRLSRIHAAARAALGDERGQTFAGRMAGILCPAPPGQSSATATPVRLSLASNA